MRDFFDGFASLDEAGREIPELLVAILAQRLDGGFRLGELPVGFPQCAHRGVFDGLVELLGGNLALADAGFPRLLLLAGIGVGLVADGARFLVLMPAQLAGDDRQESQRSGPDLHIAVFVDGRIQGIPELFHQIAQEQQGLRQNGKAFLVDVGIHQPDGNLQILAAFRQCIAGELDHQGIFGRLQRGLPFALGNVQILPPGLLDFVGNRVVAEIHATGTVTGDWFEQIVAKGHTYDGSGCETESSNCSERISRIGTVLSPSSTRSFWPNGISTGSASESNQSVSRPSFTESRG